MELEIKQQGNKLIYQMDEQVLPMDSSLWSYDTPEKLSTETWRDIDDVFNGDQGKIKFYGTQVTFDRFRGLLPKNKKSLQLSFVDQKTAFTNDYEQQLDTWFQQLLNSPLLDKTQGEAAKKRYLEAKQNVFVVNVLAKVSAGKSTLINALLGEELMPSSNNAETAKVTRIVDDDSAQSFTATALDENGLPILTLDKLTLEKMDRLNDDSTFDSVRINGNIPFASSVGYSLELVDTPGPDNMMNDSHHVIFENLITQQNKNGFKPLVVYIIPADSIGTQTTDSLLDVIRKQAAEERKHAIKNRFVFVVSKMDGVKYKEVQRTLDATHDYLESKGIKSPVIIPVAAELALRIRQLQAGKLTEEEDQEELEFKVHKQCKHSELHFNELVTDQVSEASADIDPMDAALQYTGIPLLEAKLSEYVNEYAAPERLLRLSGLADQLLNEATGTRQVEHDLKAAQTELRENETKFTDVKASLSKNAQQLQTAKLIDIQKVSKSAEEIMLGSRDEMLAFLSNQLNDFNPDNNAQRTTELNQLVVAVSSHVTNTLKQMYDDLTKFGDKYEFDAEKNFEVTDDTRQLLREGFTRLGNNTAVEEDKLDNVAIQRTKDEFNQYLKDFLELTQSFMQSGLKQRITELKTHLADAIDGLEKDEVQKQATLDHLVQLIAKGKGAVEKLTVAKTLSSAKPDLEK